jgi:hypothetical protein
MIPWQLLLMIQTIQKPNNVVVLDPDVAKTFRDSASVNEALRSLLDISRFTVRLTRRSSGSEKNAGR